MLRVYLALIVVALAYPVGILLFAKQWVFWWRHRCGHLHSWINRSRRCAVGRMVRSLWVARPVVCTSRRFLCRSTVFKPFLVRWN